MTDIKMTIDNPSVKKDNFYLQWCEIHQWYFNFQIEVAFKNAIGKHFNKK